MKTELLDLSDPAGRAAFAALGGQRAAKRARVARPDIPRAGASERTGLSGLLARGWSYWYRGADGAHRLYKINGMDTGWHASERAACDAAKRMEAMDDTGGA